jgi:magnesium-transporting ATPase (P-type)
MQLVLVGAAVVSIIAPQDVSTGLVVFGITVVNALMGLHQEGKAAESVAALRQMLIITANTRRDGEIVEVPAEDLVPGDIVSFEAGDKVPADGRLLVAATLEIEEAGLTGESTPVAGSSPSTCRGGSRSCWRRWSSPSSCRASGWCGTCLTPGPGRGWHGADHRRIGCSRASMLIPPDP